MEGNVNTNFITPIQVPDTWQGIGAAQGIGKTEAKNDIAFKDIFSNMIQNVDETEKNLEQKEYLLATGQLDDVHTVTIAASQAQLAVDMLVQMRNKAVDAYNELMRIGL